MFKNGKRVGALVLTVLIITTLAVVNLPKGGVRAEINLLSKRTGVALLTLKRRVRRVMKKVSDLKVRGVVGLADLNLKEREVLCVTVSIYQISLEMILGGDHLLA